MVDPIKTLTVSPALPPSLEPLRKLAYNLRWAWNHETIELFRRLDSDLWESTNHNPVLMLGSIDQARLEAAEGDEGFMAHLERVVDELESYMTAKSTWFSKNQGKTASPPLVGYFSAEFGLTESLSIFAGGLGVLAGDHLKSASDLGLPVVGVGLLYQQGYFRQHLNAAGWQQESYENNDFHNLPLRLVCRPDGQPLTVNVPFPGRIVIVQVWHAQVGRGNLYLLDSNIPANGLSDRDITDQLYGGGQEMRIQQEIILGIGGCRVLAALEIEPTVYHMNEGHSAFLVHERMHQLMERDDLSFNEAREVTSVGLVFTTHTPVPAGHDYFPPDLVIRYLGDFAQNLGISNAELLSLGRQNPKGENEPFCPTILALRLAAYRNGVSRLHGQVSREMWSGLWPGVPVDEVPIANVTNGVHFRSWISHEMDQLYDRYLGPRWREEPADQTIWQRAERIPSEELWRTHERRRERLVVFARHRLQAQLERRGASPAEIEAAGEALDPRVLTIGFARRFATYKRATLLLKDPERLSRLLNNPQRPVQIIFAGKAHPQDDAGKELIRRVVAFSHEPSFQGRLVFLEDYDMALARYLVQGSDIWLNTPRRPREASGTSGMKAAANGAINLSTVDGWWDEAYRPEVGWAIGQGEIYKDIDRQDQVEADALYTLLERDVVPTFYEREGAELPHRWVAFMKASLTRLCHFFNSHRMVQEYIARFYLPASARYLQLSTDDFALGRELAAWKELISQNWPQIRIEGVETKPLDGLKSGDEIHTQARVILGALEPDDVRVDFYLGRINSAGEIMDAEAHPMQPVQQKGKVWIFKTGVVMNKRSGLHGYTVRVIPANSSLVNPYLPGLILWAESKVA